MAFISPRERAKNSFIRISINGIEKCGFRANSLTKQVIKEFREVAALIGNTRYPNETRANSVPRWKLVRSYHFRGFDEIIFCLLHKIQLISTSGYSSFSVIKLITPFSWPLLHPSDVSRLFVSIAFSTGARYCSHSHWRLNVQCSLFVPTLIIPTWLIQSMQRCIRLLSPETE